MNTATTRLTHAVMIVAALAAIVIVAPVHATPAEAKAVVVLPQVTVTGKRANLAPAPVVRLPAVTVTGRRPDRTDPALAQCENPRPVSAAVQVAMR